MVDAADLKSDVREGLPVRVRRRAVLSTRSSRQVTLLVWSGSECCPRETTPVLSAENCLPAARAAPRQRMTLRTAGSYSAVRHGYLLGLAQASPPAVLRYPPTGVSFKTAKAVSGLLVRTATPCLSQDNLNAIGPGYRPDTASYTRFDGHDLAVASALLLTALPSPPEFWRHEVAAFSPKAASRWNKSIPGDLKAAEIP